MSDPETEPVLVIDGVTGKAYVGTRADIEKENERYRSDDQPAQRQAWLQQQGVSESVPRCICRDSNREGPIRPPGVSEFDPSGLHYGYCPMYGWSQTHLTPDEIAAEAFTRYYNDPLFHYRVKAAIQIIRARDELNDREVRFATYGAILALWLAELDRVTGERK
jgi:hypothetical protein